MPIVRSLVRFAATIRSSYTKNPLPILLGLATLWCIALLAGRIIVTGRDQYSFLVWNLFLAFVPLIWSFRLSAKQGRWKFWGCAALWLLFFPNAPYVVTDLIHLHRKSHPVIPTWYDVGMLSNFACVAFIFGLISLRQVHAALEERFNPPYAGILIATASFLAGFGIYLGRFLRWNSWDIVTRPWLVISDILDRFIDPFAHPRTWTVTVMFGGTILLLHSMGRAITRHHSSSPS